MTGKAPVRQWWQEADRRDACRPGAIRFRLPSHHVLLEIPTVGLYFNFNYINKLINIGW
jgi:hypothetical protein